MCAVSVAWLLSPFARAAEPSTQRPNLIFILADDLGWRDLGCYGSTFHKTPNLDTLARRGIRFTQAYAANPLCSPTRSSIMTGLWPARIGITAPVCHLKEEIFEEKLQEKAPPTAKALVAQSATRLKQEYFTLAEALKQAGYTTGHFGKWHLGHEPYDPLHQGFDVDFPHYAGPSPAGSYIAPWQFPEPLPKGRPGEHIEDRVSEEVVKFIRTNKDRPFFVNYWCFSVHGPWIGKKELIEKYRNQVDPNNPQRNPVYAAMVESLDDGVGRVMKTVDELGLAGRTIIIFFSDNGGVSWHDARMKNQFGMDVPPTSNLPLRGGKATVYEGGTREPCIVVWPGITKPDSTSDAIIQSIDFYPTILEMLGLKAPADQKFDGISIVPAIQGRPIGRDTLYCHFPHPGSDKTGPATWVRKGDWKLIRRYADNDDQTDRFELYNLRDDLGETKDLAAQMPEKLKELNALIDQFLKSTSAVVPKPNPAYNREAAVLARFGWTAGKDVRGSIAGGELVLESTGPDPMIITHGPLDLEGPLMFEVRMKSNSEGPAQVFWSPGPKAPFQRARSVFFKPEHDGEWHEHQVNLPIKGRINSLRFDPSASTGAIRIQWIRLKDNAGKTVKEWRFDRAP
jgi:arylsulfatase A-like enzyme